MPLLSLFITVFGSIGKMVKMLSGSIQKRRGSRRTVMEENELAALCLLGNRISNGISCLLKHAKVAAGVDEKISIVRS